ncbi:zinc finger protein [Colletotrichum incanum]|uniref:Zinc finger protein n=1 Tax=Colletotrichum incanum TaxID=1573173 RepID=A0A162NFU3_COLIC|nr:zinc finger protein [Colletotrichum incanum]
MVYACGVCWREFPSGWRARDQHCDATGHCPPAYECALCDYCFDNDQDKLDHERGEHLHCSTCGRDFQSWNNIHQHLKSRVHRGSNMSCPFCGVNRTSATGVVHHLERGSCPNAPLDRDSLYLAVHRRDPDGILSKKLLEFHGSTQYSASEEAYNYRLNAYQCYLCGNLYAKLNSLNQHLASPAHQQAYYHCPNRICGREFTTLGATMNHLESESCGFMRFEAVQSSVGRILDSRRMISL